MLAMVGRIFTIDTKEMENKYYFDVYYGKACVWSVVAHTKWEAIDKAYYKFSAGNSNLERTKFRVKRK